MYLETASFKVKLEGGHWREPYSNTTGVICPYKGRSRHSQTQRDDHVRSQGEKVAPQGERSSWETRRWTPWSWTWSLQNHKRTNVCGLSHPVRGTLLWQPGRRTCCPIWSASWAVFPQGAGLRAFLVSVLALLIPGRDLWASFSVVLMSPTLQQPLCLDKHDFPLPLHTKQMCWCVVGLTATLAPFPSVPAGLSSATTAVIQDSYVWGPSLSWLWTFLSFFKIIFIFLFFRAPPLAYGGSQARGGIGTVAASLCHSHSNAKSEPHLSPTPQLMAMLDP